jgi:hypothetical protein
MIPKESNMQPVFRVAYLTILAISFRAVPPTTLDFSELPDRESMEASIKVLIPMLLWCRDQILSMPKRSTSIFP